MVVVRLVNELLERGVAYADAPGLHDPSPDIRALTATALQSAHAILYVLDVSPARNGGFSISTHHVDDLSRFRGMAERLFIILNKADILSTTEREDVKSYLEKIFREHDLWDALPVEPMFISAQGGWEWQRSGRIGQSPLAVLEEAIWTHLLSTNSTGLDRLIAAVTELRRAGSDFASLLETRRMSGGEAFSLRKSLEACRAREQELVTACHERAKIDEAFVRHRLTKSCVALLRRLQERLEKVPLNQQLPPASHIEKEF